jgi:uncharacterized protein
MPPRGAVARLEIALFGHRATVITLFALATLFMAWQAGGLRVDAGFTKLLPLEHEYMQTFLEHEREFGGANRVLVALVAREGDIFRPEFFERLRQVTDEVFFLPGVDRTQVYSLFTPNVRYTEVVEDGIAGGNVIPDDFEASPVGFETVRENILKAGILGRLVANDFAGALVSASLQEIDPRTGERLDLVAVSRALEERVRDRHASPDIDIHIIGFAKVVGDIAEGATRVVAFLGIAFLITAALVWLYAQSLRLALVPLVCSLVAVVWQLGLLNLLGFGIDPMSILVPFLVFAIAVSHGVQMLSAVRAEVYLGQDSLAAARASFRRLLLPGAVALASDTIGFITILLIEIRIIQEMAITASLGVAAIILTNLVLLPLLLSGLHFTPRYRAALRGRASRLEALWARIAGIATPGPALAVLAVSVGLGAWGAWKATEVRIGDLHAGVPELRPEARYNVDSEVITERFSIGVDLLTVIVEGAPDGCIDHDVMTAIDHLAWVMRNVEGVQSTQSLAGVAKVINSGWNEGSLAWRVLPRNRDALAQSVAHVPTASGLLNVDCSVIPVHVFTSDHRAETIIRVVDRVKDFAAEHGSERLDFRLATGNVGVMAATNEEVAAAQFPILAYVFAAIVILCLLSFQSLRSTLCIVLPLAMVSLLAYALMAILQIGLKVSTLPVVALGVGVGVDYGIYIYSRLRSQLEAGEPLVEAYRNTLRIAGTGVVFTGATLAIGVATWIFAPLKFQADMGVLLTFMFVVNMLGAILVLPALVYWLRPVPHPRP